MNADERLAAAREQARERLYTAEEAQRHAQATAAREERAQRDRARRGPTRPDIARAFAIQARKAGIEWVRLNHEYDAPSERVSIDVWNVPTLGLTSKALYITTNGGLFVGTSGDLLTAPWKHDASALRTEQLERLLAEFLVTHEPRPTEPKALTSSVLWKSATEGALDGVLLGSVPILLIALLGGIGLSNILLWVFPIGGVVVGVAYAVWLAGRSGDMPIALEDAAAPSTDENEEPQPFQAQDDAERQRWAAYAEALREIAVRQELTAFLRTMAQLRNTGTTSSGWPLGSWGAEVGDAMTVYVRADGVVTLDMWTPADLEAGSRPFDGVTRQVATLNSRGIRYQLGSLEAVLMHHLELATKLADRRD